MTCSSQNIRQEKGLTHARKWMSFKNVTLTHKLDTKGHVSSGYMYMKCPGQPNSDTAGSLVRAIGGGDMGVTTRDLVSSWGGDSGI